MSLIPQLDNAKNVSDAILQLQASSFGYFNGDYFSDHPVPVLLLQLFIASSMAVLVSTLLKTLGVPEMISQIIAGVLMGPSCLSRTKAVRDLLFNEDLGVNMGTYAGLGTVFQIFLVGVQVNPMMAIHAGWKATTIGVTILVVPLALTFLSITAIGSFVEDITSTQYDILTMVGIVESLTSFPVIAYYLADLNILNSEFSRMAFTSTMFSGFLGFLTVTAALVQFARCLLFPHLSVLALYVVEVAVIICVLRPAIGWIIKHTPNGKRVKEQHLAFVFISLLLLEYACITAGIQREFGPFVFGMSIPCGPPIGSALVERLEFFNKWMVMPIFYAKHGMSIDIFEIEWGKHLLTILVVVVACVGKFLGAFLPALYHKMSFNDAVSLGLTVNAQGFIEITLFWLLRGKRLIDSQTFDVMSITMVVITGGFTPLLRYLYNSSMKREHNIVRTIQHSDPDAELRLLACVYDQENVPSMIHLLKATNPTPESPIYVSVINFVELVGHATPVIISHKKKKMLPSNSMSRRILNVFKHYEENDKRLVYVNPYTVVSPYTTLHNDLCSLALQKSTSLVILPFHRSLITGDINSGIRMANCNVLDKAPCSVGILIDRGVLGGLKFVFEEWVAYNVVVIFYGGADDREALAYGERMSSHPAITLTLIHVIAEGDDKYIVDETDRIEDEEMISKFRSVTEYNDRVRYIEVKVQHGVEVVTVFESIGEGYQLIVLGRRHDANSSLILELTDWNKCSELGTIGDIFVNSGCGGQATILVLQQHSLEESDDPFYNGDILGSTKGYDC